MLRMSGSDTSYLSTSSMPVAVAEATHEMRRATAKRETMDTGWR
jgi:hypothetical protein